MTAASRIKALLAGERLARPAISGWRHLPLVDRDPAAFIRKTISLTDENRWDFIKVMSNGHYLAEAYGADILFPDDPTQWSGVFRRYPIAHADDLATLPVLDRHNPVLAREVEIVRGLARHYQGSVPLLPTLFTPLTWIQEMTQSTQPGPTLAFIRRHPAALRRALDALLQTNLNFLDALLQVGIDGVFLATQYARADLLSEAEYQTFCRPYDEAILKHIKGKTWFNILHIHGESQLLFEPCLDYDLQAFNWENVPESVEPAGRVGVAQIRALTDKILIAGIDQHRDFHYGNGARPAVKARLQQRLRQIRAESGDRGFIFAPGCALPLDVDDSLFTLLAEIGREQEAR
ncbi:MULTISPECIES: uroporphyrinogen decarboxylase family protein [unclassified Brenneria]|uniref:uroporphyrinogen decarboxylase family protein n=1 Tax=unclassified Brenneria TaxID=2634434 RepID=UPI0029C456DD|nr:MULTISPECIES: uroporphyrinogen decarboxylase family protein [unclassified Brenneria]MDX5627555.1 uroporphyrinogen decarboxylase family protein [Brenneria sp. L3-3Z]MDX5694289.1 uroporphyrinogen decarboxylase family protein [Brenneria sp. L4-2C]